MSFPPMYLAIWNTESLLLLVVPHADPEMLAHAAIYAKAASLGIPVSSNKRSDAFRHTTEGAFRLWQDSIALGGI